MAPDRADFEVRIEPGLGVWGVQAGADASFKQDGDRFFGFEPLCRQVRQGREGRGDRSITRVRRGWSDKPRFLIIACGL